MTNKEGLNRGWKLWDEIESLERVRAKTAVLAGREGAAEMDRRIEKKQKELIKVYLQIFRAINRLPGSKDRRVLQLRYLACLPQEEIAYIMGYEEVRSVARAIDRAAERIERWK